MTSTAAASPPSTNDTRPWWKSTWPFERSDVMRLGVALAVIIAVYVIVGYTLTDWAAPNAVTELDEDWAQRLADGRTETNNDLAKAGSLLADTPIKIGLSVAIFVAMLYRWRRWHEAAFVALTLIFEAAAYAVSSTIIGRPRPDVVRLAESPVDTSFPSGHVAAATVYAALAVIVFWHTRNKFARVVASVVVVAIPVIVALARMYKGMHFFSDVVAGSLLGALSVWICLNVMGRPRDAVEPSPGGRPLFAADRHSREVAQ